jgi:hypothetical protein
MSLSGDGFNGAAESYYRETLRLRHFTEAFELLEEEISQIDAAKSRIDDRYRRVLTTVIGSKSGAEFLREIKEDVIHERADSETLRLCIHLTLLIVCRDREIAGSVMDEAEPCSA